MSEMSTDCFKQLSPRALVALLLLSAGLATAATGVGLSLTPRAYELRHIHLATAFLFVTAAVGHASYNLKPLTRYLLTRDNRGGLRLEARVALIITTLAVVAGWLWAPGRPQ